MQSSIRSPRLVNELRHVAENLDLSAFRALSPGIGLVALKPVIERPIPKRRLERVEGAAEQQVVIETLPGSSRQRSGIIELARGLTRFACSHAIDLLIVGSSIAIAVMLAGFVFYLKNRGIGASSNWMAPLKWLSRYNILEMLAGLYAIFIAYWLVFRVAAGRTFGEGVVFGSKVAPNPVGKKDPLKINRK